MPDTWSSSHTRSYASSPDPGDANWLERTLRFVFRVFALVISLSAWTVFGAVAWAWLFSRNLAMLSFMSVVAGFGDAHIDKYVNRMQNAVLFYPRHFKQIIDTFLKPDKNAYADDLWPSFGRMVIEIVAAVLFFWLPLTIIVDSPRLWAWLSPITGGAVWLWEMGVAVLRGWGLPIPA